jgi:late competence protein required for DNA uptake (superfamily II DNA/RNA helicase)
MHKITEIDLYCPVCGKKTIDLDERYTVGLNFYCKTCLTAFTLHPHK